MMRRFGHIFLVVFLTFSIFTGVDGTESTLPLDQVQVGMKGKGKSVFEDDRIEEFKVEILGILRNVQPKRSIILAKLEGERFNKAGVISGMSGSPVYVEGKLIGAIAYSFPFAKEPIAGITPIEEMLGISDQESPKSSFASKIPIKKHLDLEELFELNKEFFHSKSAFFSEGQTFKPLNIPLVFNGFSSSVFERTKSFFSRLGFNPVMAGPSNQEIKRISPPEMTLKEGDPVSVQLVTGDLNLAAVGTVSHVDGNRVLAFGHPVYNLGAVDYAMSKARVISVIPSVQQSFKVASPEDVIGAFTQDRTSGLFGEVGKFPKLVPINISVREDGEKGEVFKVNVVDDRILTPVLVNISVANILSAEERSIGNLSLKLKGNVYLENGLSIGLEDLYSGQFDTSVNNLSSLLSAVIYFLINNEFKEVKIHRIDLEVHASEDVKQATLEKVWLDKYEVSPGERIRIKVHTRSFRGISESREVGIDAPHLPPGSEFQLVIADVASMHQIELGQYRRPVFVPRSLNQLIRILGSLRKNNRIYFKIIASKPGLFLRGEEMPNLPPTMKHMFISPRAAASAPIEITKSTLREYQLDFPYVFRGVAVIPIRIKK